LLSETSAIFFSLAKVFRRASSRTGMGSLRFRKAALGDGMNCFSDGPHLVDVKEPLRSEASIRALKQPNERTDVLPFTVPFEVSDIKR
jgi:hypothetical protein